MSSEWELKKLSEVANFLNSKRIPLSSIEREKRKGSYPYYGASGVVDHIDDYIFDGTYLLISEDGENLRTRNTPIAFKAKGKFWVNNHAHILSEKQEGILDYLEYFFSVLDLSPYITGAVQPKLNKANLDSIEIPIPDENIRLKINAVLNSLTNKIELNNQINQTLEAMAQAIFKNWFVDFEPVKAKMAVLQAGCSYAEAELAAMMAISGKTAEQLSTMRTTQAQAYQQLTQTAALFPAAMQESELGVIPEGWRNGFIGEISNVKAGYAFKGDSFISEGNSVVKIKNITGNGDVDIIDCQFIDDNIAQKASKFKLNDGDLLMAMTGATVAKTGILVTEGRNVYLNQRVAKFESEKFGSKISWFLYCCFDRDNIFDLVVGAAQGSAQPNISSSGIEATSITLPNDALIHTFCDKTNSLFQQWMLNKCQNSKLKEIRDSLLPKLLSGELRIPSVMVEGLT